MSEKFSILSQNLRFLRKLKKISQEELAQKLNIKRSNIAAYESKNVEPRLRIILEIAKFFNIDVKTLIEEKVTADTPYKPYITQHYSEEPSSNTIDVSNKRDVSQFIEKSIKVRKILEGFKAFYSFKKNELSNASPEKVKLTYDIDNFIQLMEHLLTYNESVIKAISNSEE